MCYNLLNINITRQSKFSHTADAKPTTSAWLAPGTARCINIGTLCKRITNAPIAMVQRMGEHRGCPEQGAALGAGTYLDKKTMPSGNQDPQPFFWSLKKMVEKKTLQEQAQLFWSTLEWRHASSRHLTFRKQHSWFQTCKPLMNATC